MTEPHSKRRFGHMVPPDTADWDDIYPENSKDLVEEETRPAVVESYWPRDESELQQTETLIARELGNLSVEDHESILFDLHGVNSNNNSGETERASPSSQLLLAEMRNHLEAIPNKLAYDCAKQWNSAYVESEQFQMLFLRAVFMDPRAAAERIVMHFDVKSELFGPGEILGRDIKLSDLGPNDMITLRSGCLRVLPNRDLAGRTVVMSSLRRRKIFGDVVTVRRTQWYIYMSLLEEIETSLNGFVTIISHFGNTTWIPDMGFMSAIQRVRRSLPIRYLGAHHVYDDIRLRALIFGIKWLVIPGRDKFRMLDHYGSPQETKFTLQTYGIITSGAPGDNHTCVIEEEQSDEIAPSHTKWLDQRFVLEQRREAIAAAKAAAAASAASIEMNQVNPVSLNPVVPVNTPGLIAVPRRLDVLFGKGKQAREHVGNVRCQLFVEMHWDRYNKAGRQEKTNIATAIVEAVYKSNGRFLRRYEAPGDKGSAQSSNFWIEVDSLAARDKVSHFFRQRREQLARARQNGEAPETSDANGVKRTLERLANSNE
mmetsp:Transcript_30209/g.63125  ORF Transcript_30209/g.63125 Transcript_30209/m.63125 type:complete len:542 (-) Transcript_30209:610-2235(-)